MSKQYAKKQVLDKSKNISSENEKQHTYNLFSRNRKKIYPIGLQRTCSPLSLSSLSLSLSQNSTDSSLTDPSTPLDQKISFTLRLIAPVQSRDPKTVEQSSSDDSSQECTRRCNWITKNSGQIFMHILHQETKMIDFAVAREYGSFGSYMWEYVSFKPMINKFRYPRNVPLRSPKAEAISKDLMRRGFRFVGPVIVYSFMQAAGMTIDHLVGCFRYKECVNLAERPWRHV
ncbi:DNA-3-methyladenine glycosylase 1 [Sesamum angolense]|uniref:DNA-3-methyladenine glycosylase 1 n=1 Tax=Sesamum angolense TaxID=2727404 RepID=A0AAE1XEK7_9LAMI|nr:DNA-3-methyladenine glycosylase 1 [Sesamum angolense]